MNEIVLDTSLKQARRAGDLDTAHALMLGEAIERGDDNAEAASAVLDHLLLTSERRLDDVRELIHVQQQAEIHAIRERWLG